MKISWLGHASFLIETSQGTKLVTDPYESGAYSGAVGYAPIEIVPDVVTVSHSHADHGYVKDFTSSTIVDERGAVTVKDIEIEGIPSYHDKQRGSARGGNIIFKIKADGITLVHFGDLGTLDIDYEKVQSSDVALIPVGGTFTLDSEEATKLVEKIKPRIVIPMHFKTAKLKFDIDSVEPFLNGKTLVEKSMKSIEVTKDTLPLSTKIVVLDFLR